MINAFSINVGGLRFLGSFKAAKEFLRAINVDATYPSVPMGQENYAEDPGFTPGRCPSHVLKVLCNGYISKIGKTVVSAAAGYVVNVKTGPLASHKEEGQSVKVVVLAVDTNPSVPSGFGLRAKNLANFGGVALRGKARENAGFWVVVQDFFKTCLSKHLVAFRSGGYIQKVGVGQGVNDSPFRPLNLVQPFQFIR